MVDIQSEASLPVFEDPLQPGHLSGSFISEIRRFGNIVLQVEQLPGVLWVFPNDFPVARSQGRVVSVDEKERVVSGSFALG